MPQYELIREIQNLCRNNQMRNISFDEIECSDPADYVRSLLRDSNVQLSVDRSGGDITVHAVCGNLTQKFVFSLLDD